MAFWTVTANFLADGGVAYLSADRAWTRDLQQAVTVDSEAGLEPLLGWAKGQEHEICDPYALPVSREADRLTPLSARERIRAEGPEPTLERLGYPVALEAARRQRRAG